MSGPEAIENAADQPAVDELSAVRAERDQFKDLAYRAAAELENFKRRAAKEREDLSAAQKERFVSRLLPALDAFEMAAAATESGVPEDVRKKYLEGYLAIGRQIWAILESAGVSVVETPANAEFHPGEMEAVMTEEVEGLNAPMVLQVMQKGYRMDGRLVRPARVKVGMPRDENAGNANEVIDHG